MAGTIWQALGPGQPPSVVRGVHDERQLCAVGLIGVFMLAKLVDQCGEAG